MPVYNREESLPRAVSSVLGQTFTDFELILVDDGSTDSSLSVASACQKQDSRVQVLSQENRGVCVARNHGISKAGGRYVCFLDSDDEVTKDWLQHFYEATVTTNHDIAFCDMIMRRSGVADQRVKAQYPYDPEKYDESGLFQAGTYVMRSDYLQEIGLFDEQIKFGEFTEIAFRCRKKGFTKTYTNHADFIYYLNSTGGGKHQQNKIAACLYLMEKHSWYFKKYPEVKRYYYQNIAVSHARLGNLPLARLFFGRAYLVQPWQVSTVFRFLLACIPWLARRKWSISN